MWPAESLDSHSTLGSHFVGRNFAIVIVFPRLREDIIATCNIFLVILTSIFGRLSCWRLYSTSILSFSQCTAEILFSDAGGSGVLSLVLHPESMLHPVLRVPVCQGLDSNTAMHVADGVRGPCVCRMRQTIRSSQSKTGFACLVAMLIPTVAQLLVERCHFVDSSAHFCLLFNLLTCSQRCRLPKPSIF